MELVSVKIRGTVVSARYGTLTAGDILRTDADYARHLVDDCNAATYADAQRAQTHEPKGEAEAPKNKQRKARG
jgi:hypothetical protein